MGRLGADPEIREFGTDKKRASLRLAINEVYFNTKGERTEETSWHLLVLWNREAEKAGRLLKKGDEICIEGRLSTRSYEGKDGKKKYVTEVVVSEFALVSSREAVPETA